MGDCITETVQFLIASFKDSAAFQHQMCFDS